jgi:hypothetical protein
VSTSLQAVDPAGAGTAHDGRSGDGLIENVFANLFIEPPVHLLADDFLKCTAARVHLSRGRRRMAVRRFADPRISSTATHRWWHRQLEKVGIVATGETSGERMHKARHTAGQRVLDATGDLKLAQRLLGHARSRQRAMSTSITTT